ncbi:unnamed protein product, partial [Iphiclides podalirius]
MSTNKKYRCVNCGKPCSALYRTYGKSVLKLTKCAICKGIVDKYIEYDPVIVMIDLVLVSKEAQRHILYNTDFKAYWKLFIILTMLETYAVWRSDSLFSIAVNTICDVNSINTVNSTKINIPFSLPESWISSCRGWIQEGRGDDTDLFIWEKDFYVQFLSTLSGIIIFIATTHVLMEMIQSVGTRSKGSVGVGRLLRAFSLSASGGAFSLAALVWGASAARSLHYALVALYAFVVFGNVFSVVYETPTYLTMLALVVSNTAKCYTTFHMTPFLRGFIS